MSIGMLCASLVLATQSHAESDFEKVLKVFPELPAKMLDADIYKLKSQQHAPIVSYFFQKENGDQYLRVGKTEVDDGYVLLLGLLVTSGKHEQINIHGYFYDDDGKFVDKEPYICNTGSFSTYRSVCNISYKNDTFTFAQKEVTYSGQESEFNTSTYRTNDDGFKFKKRSNDAF